MENVGEMISWVEYKECKQEEMREGPVDFYFTALQDGKHIETLSKEHTACFISHSCKPNATLEYWSVDDLCHGAILAYSVTADSGK